MSTDTKIEWATKTWGPVLGCKKVSAGCDNCYAIRTAHRLASNPNPKVADAYADLTERTEQGLDWTGVVRTLPERLQDPMRWRKPERIFVNSQSDLFHPAVGADFIARVFATMAATGRHTYQVLTKRPIVAARMLRNPAFWVQVERYAWDIGPAGTPFRIESPLRNVWIGVSVEDQETANLRIRTLMAIPAAVRWISAEPLLGDLDIYRWLTDEPGAGLDWVVVGGESGPGARPMHPDWARSIRDQCAAAGVPMLFKQWGVWSRKSPGLIRNPYAAGSFAYRRWVEPDGTNRPFGEFGSSAECLTWADMHRVGKKAAGRELDGVTHDAYPETAVPA